MMKNNSPISVFTELENQLFTDNDASGTDSDEIDSDIEFHLYSQLHYASHAIENSDVDECCESESEKVSDTETKGSPEVECKAGVVDVIYENLQEPISNAIDAADTSKNDKKIAEVAKPKKSKSSGMLESFDKDDLARLRNRLSESSETDFVPESWEIVDSVDDTDSDDGGLDIHISEKIQAEMEEEMSNDAWIPGKGPKSCWKIDDSDKKSIMTKDSRGRYYGGPTKASRMECRNCNETGHKAIDCPDARKQPACFMCGIRGHVGRDCPEKDNLRQRGRRMECNRCGQEGHIQVDCPDQWREFHITTKPGPIVIPDIPVKLKDDPQCYNCAGYGHFGHECESERYQLYHGILSPLVHRYDKMAVVQIPQDLRKKLKPSKRSTNDFSNERETNRHRRDEEYRSHKREKVSNKHIIFHSPSPTERHNSKRRRDNHSKHEKQIVEHSRDSGKQNSVNDNKHARKHDTKHISHPRPPKGSIKRICFDDKLQGAIDYSPSEKQPIKDNEIQEEVKCNEKNLKKSRKRKKKKIVDKEMPNSSNANLFDERVVSFGNQDKSNVERNYKSGRTVTFKKDTREEEPLPQNSKPVFENDDFFVSNKSRKRKSQSNAKPEKQDRKKIKFSNNKSTFNGDRGFRKHFS